MKKRTRQGLLGCLLVAVVTLNSSCYGPFKITKALHEWNGQVGEKWVNELVFLGLVILPVYGFATLGDAIIFNSIEFWTGENPVDEVTDAGEIKTIEDGERTIELTRQRTDEGVELTIRVFEKGVLVDESVLLAKADGTATRTGADGELIAEGEVLPDGRLLVADASSGSERVYSRSELVSLVR